MANYRITANPDYNSNEVYFESKPAPDVLAALKNLKMRWNPRKGCWYGFASEWQIMEAILGNAPAEESATVTSDGYMGGGAIYGSKSHRSLYGSDLSAAIRADIKAAGVKGVSIRCKSYSGGQSITATMKMDMHDFLPMDDFIAAYQIPTSQCWIWDGEEHIHSERYWGASSAEEQERIRTAAARAEYIKYTTTEQNINHHHIEQYTHLQPAAMERMKKVQAIISAYRYDESNSMVDYFNTNFYYDIYTKPVAA